VTGGLVCVLIIFYMRENVVKNKSFAFAVRVVKLYQFLCKEKTEFVLSKQLLRSGTSVGAMVREAEHMQVRMVNG
jgi:four helix bundle protein